MREMEKGSWCFNPHPRAGVNAVPIGMPIDRSKFQSPPPCGGELRAHERFDSRIIVSIPTPVRG